MWSIEDNDDLRLDSMLFRKLDRCANAIQRAVEQSPFPVRRDDHGDLGSP